MERPTQRLASLKGKWKPKAPKQQPKESKEAVTITSQFMEETFRGAKKQMRKQQMQARKMEFRKNRFLEFEEVTISGERNRRQDDVAHEDVDMDAPREVDYHGYTMRDGYFPTVLPLGERDRDTTQPAAKDYGFESNSKEAILGTTDAWMTDERLFYIQLPRELPIRNTGKMTAAEQRKNPLARIPDGKIGDLVVLDDGRMILELNGIEHEMIPGATCGFMQNIYELRTTPDGNDRTHTFTGEARLLGQMSEKIVVMPNVTG
ncbi:DNA-directed RNA polymerase III subunit RPC4 [Carpediemonas membranifera]|uniref:DNA-directed RNA polymerase III subunit RPC4 n=1 Tax=Carpediemonas membranifera TaxID=201153 RepID=A0A8J6B789_9EUKA|nr:DNA-directed RNA polymerase III subunit RPC4 [Carpediemonas membranifera]|eukprot:KAG9394559.1 DNA-directed RNA polymerase III subunit RPC4 [Carpediemonas membranifera]